MKELYRLLLALTIIVISTFMAVLYYVLFGGDLDFCQQLAMCMFGFISFIGIFGLSYMRDNL